MKEVMNAKDFMWYKQELDVMSRYEHRHRGEPDKYPCIVRSSFWDDPNGPYTYDHSFVYKEECSLLANAYERLENVKEVDCYTEE
jgi:hypothetical protein